jgi:hypothetical protein
MFRARFVVAVLFLPTLAALCSAQSAASSTTTCTLEDGREVYIRYNPVSAKSERPAAGKPWAPGGVPMTLFTEAPLSFGGASLPLGAYTVYPIPNRDKWVLVVNKNVTPGSAYDEKQDIARTTMETDQVAQSSDALEVAFAHIGAKCTVRIYFGKAASFADFTVK